MFALSFLPEILLGLSCHSIPKKYLTMWSTRSVFKNSLKIGFVPVDLTEVSSLTISISTGKNYNILTNYHISAKVTCWDHFTLT